MGKFLFSQKVFKPAHWRSLRNLSLRNRKSMGKFFERFSLDLKITANQRETVSKKPVSKKPEWVYLSDYAIACCMLLL